MLKAVATSLALIILAAASGCATGSPYAWPPPGHEPTTQQVLSALASWPGDFERPCFLTLQARGVRVSMPGVVGRKAGMVRIVAVTDIGGVLIDARSNGKDVEVQRIMPELNNDMARLLVSDLATALQPPGPLEACRREAGVTQIASDSGASRVVFGPDGHPWVLEARDAAGPFYLRYLAWDDRGRWAELDFTRPRRYRVQLTFTDGG